MALAAGIGSASGPSPESAQISLCEILDRVLSAGVVVRGHIVVSVADVDLLYLGLNVLLASTETLAADLEARGARPGGGP